MKRQIMFLVSIYVAVLPNDLTHAQSKAERRDTCASALPAGAKQAVLEAMRDWKLVTLADLGGDEQRIWKEQRGDQCPGAVAGHFNNQHGASFAVTLVRKRENSIYQTLVLLSKNNHGSYHMLTLDRPQRTARVSVVAKLPPGKYSSWDQATNIEAKFEVISYQVIEAGAVAFYWTGHEYKKLHTSE